MENKSKLQDTQKQIGRRKTKSPKGSVKIENDKGWLRFRFTHQYKRYTFAIGLPDTELNRKIAQQKARKIELDILSENFDLTLEKYKPFKKQKKSSLELLSGQDLVQKFIDDKAKTVSTPRSLEKYNTVLKHLQNFHCKDGRKKLSLANITLNRWNDNHIEMFYDYFIEKLMSLLLKAKGDTFNKIRQG